MNELFQGFLCCDLVSVTDSETGDAVAKLQFNPGRLGASLMMIALIGTAAILIA